MFLPFYARGNIVFPLKVFPFRCIILHMITKEYETIYDLIVIGGGASGLTAAAVALSRGKKVILLESSDRVGKKILLAGNGRCNIGNVFLSTECYNTPLVSPFLEKKDKVFSFFDRIGLCTRVIDGRVYPYSESGKTVLNLLRAPLAEEIVVGSPVEEIKKEGDLFSVGGFLSRAVVVATGSKATVGRESYDLLTSFGHTLRVPLPALCPLSCNKTDVKGLSGLRAKVALTLLDGEKPIVTRRGEILFKEDGVSGIVTMELSRFLLGEKTLSVDFAPDYDADRLKQFLSDHSPEGLVQRLIAERVSAQCSSRSIPLSVGLKDYRIRNAKRVGYKQAQVMQGGIPLDEYDGSLQSRLCPGLYACGEVLDVDGDCGGYNLFWAFLSGIIVGESV